jgi:hypothetical protein
MTKDSVVTTRYPIFKTALIVALSLQAVVAATAFGTKQDATKPSPQAPAFQPAYFPVAETGGSLLSQTLFSLGEPSLLEASKDPSVRSFRLSIFSSVPIHGIAVRLVINPDGSGKINAAVAGGKTSEIKRIERNVSVADVEKFLSLVDKARFWSMTSGDSDPTADSKGRRAYVMDGSEWMLEGVQKSSYHCVFRSNPNPQSSYVEVARYLSKDLAKLDELSM